MSVIRGVYPSPLIPIAVAISEPKLRKNSERNSATETVSAAQSHCSVSEVLLAMNRF